MADTTNQTTGGGSTGSRRSTGARRSAAATRRSTTAKRSATTRQARATKRTASRGTARTQTRAAREAAAAQREAGTVVGRVGHVAERGALAYVGATLSARDKLTDLVTTYSDPAKLQQEVKRQRTRLERRLKGFERRGATARNRLEREVKRQRTRVERELRQRTHRVERDVRALRTDAGRFRRDLELTAVAQQLELGRAVAGNVAQGAALGVTKAARQVTDRVASVVA